MEAVEFVHDFLTLYSTLEQAKEDWACRKLGIADVKTSKQHHALLYVFWIHLCYIFSTLFIIILLSYHGRSF